MSTVTQAVATREAKPAKVTPEEHITQLLKASQRAIARALPRGMSEERFGRILLTTVRQNPDLIKCDPMTVLGAAMTAAQLGLEPGPLGEAYLVPFGRTCTFVPGAPGLVKLAIQSGHIQSVRARTVYAGDFLSYSYGLNEHLDHTPTEDVPGPATHHYAIATFTNGSKEFIVMTQAQIDDHRRKFARSKQAWDQNPEAMARKTVVKQLMKFLPKSAEMAAAMDADGATATLSETAAEPVQISYGDAIETQAIEPPADVDTETGEITNETGTLLDTDPAA